MPGYVIHVAIANEYLRKNKGKVKNVDKFILGVLTPDNTADKSLTHYGENSSRPNLRLFLEKNGVNNDYDMGYFLHLLTDYLFFNYYFVFSKDVLGIDDDYKIGGAISDKYNVDLPSGLKKRTNLSGDKPDYMKINLLENMIEEISGLDLNKAIDDIRNYNYVNINGTRIETDVFRRY